MTDPPRLKNPTFQQRGQGDAAELRTVSPPPRKPVSMWHRAFWWAHHHLTRDRLGEWKDTSGWKGQAPTTARRSTASYRERERANDRETHAAAAHAQSLREEATTMGGAEERRAFYGSRHAASNRDAETRARGVGAARERHEAEQRAADKQRPRRGFKW